MEENEPIGETNENNEQIEDDVPDEIFDEDFSKTESLSISLSKEGEDVTISEPTEIKEEIIGNFVNRKFRILTTNISRYFLILYHFV